MLKKEKIYFPNLDGLRFIAFFLVFLQHGFNKPLQNLNVEIYSYLLRPFAAGEAGVSFFFVLSGFLITYLILSEIQMTGKIDVIAFYIRRILRIFPLYYLTVIWGIVIYSKLKILVGLPGYVEFGDPLLYFFFLANFDVINLSRIGLAGAMSTNITWSVAIEEQFYLGWVLFFYLLNSRFYKYIFPLIIGGSMLFRIIHREDEMVLYFHTFSVISDMAVGGAAAYLTINSTRFREFFRTLDKRWIILIYVIGTTVFWFEHQLFPSWMQRFFPTIFYAFIILEQNYAESSIFKMENFKRISSLGKYTYGLYLLHPIAILFCDIVPRFLRINVEGFGMTLAQAVMGFFVSLLFSYLSYHLFEKKFLSLKKRFAHIQSGN